MKLRVLVAVIFLAVVGRPALPQQDNQPLTKSEVLDLVKFGMDSVELAKKVKDRGIDFEPTADYLDALRKAGAQEPVIQALREKPKPLTKQQVGELVVGGVPSERGAALVRQRGIEFEADEQYLDTLRVAGADASLLDALRTASITAAAAQEQKNLTETGERLAQIKSWNMMSSQSLIQKAVAGDHLAGVLSDKLNDKEKAFDRWQSSEWVPDPAAQKGGSLVTMLDGGRAMFC